MLDALSELGGKATLLLLVVESVAELAVELVVEWGVELVAELLPLPAHDINSSERHDNASILGTGAKLFSFLFGQFMWLLL